MNERIIAVGDIHGCHHEFAGLLEMLELQAGDRLILWQDTVTSPVLTLPARSKALTLDARSKALALTARSKALTLATRSKGLSLDTRTKALTIEERGCD